MQQNYRNITFFLIFFSKLLFSEGTLFHIQGDSTDTVRLNFVFLAEGYTVNQEQNFRANVAKLADSMFLKSPYKQYRSFFNIWGIFVPSEESGADHPKENIYKSTYFGAAFSTVIPQSLTCSNRKGIFGLLAEHVPDYDNICLLVNDTTYGGSGGDFAVVSVNRIVFPMLIHETGHSFAKLGDEYEGFSNISGLEYINVTAVKNRDNIKWNCWILPQTPVPTPEDSSYSTVVGLFEGALNKATGWFRPKLQCLMRSLDTTFCEVCIEAHIYQIYSHISSIKSFSPQETTIVYKGNSLPFSVETHSPLPNTQLVSWFLDDQIISQNAKSIKVTESQIKNGGFSVRVIVKDTTPMVRNPAFFKTLADTIQWRVSTVNTIAQQKNFGKDVFALSVIVKNKVVVLQNQSNYNGALNIAIFNMQGQQVASRRIEPSKHAGNQQFIYQLPVSKVNAGTFFLTVSKPALASSAYHLKVVIY